MQHRISQALPRAGYLALIVLCIAVDSIRAAAGELSVDDFKFDGPSKADCLEAGAVLMNSISEYYRGTKCSQQE